MLLVIAVMFTFSFGSAFAALGAPGTCVDNEAAARAYIEKQAKELREAIAADFDKEEVDAKALLKTAPYELAAYLEKLAELEGKAGAAVNKQVAQAYSKFDAAISAAGTDTILGYVVADDSVAADADYYDSYYVDVYEIVEDYLAVDDVITAIKSASTATAFYGDFIDEWFTDNNADYVELVFEKAVKGTIDNLNAIDLTVVSDKVSAHAAATPVTADGTFGISEFGQSFNVTIPAGTTDYAAAVMVREALVAYLGGLDPETDNQASDASDVTTNFLLVYELDYPGTADEKVGGWFGDLIGSTWKTTAQATVNGSVVEYAKAKFKEYALGAIQTEWNETVGAQNQIIWQQKLLAKPNAATIKEAEDAIEAANKKYEAVTEVWTYVVENAEYYVSSGKVFIGWDENADGDYTDADEWTYSFATYDGTTFSMTPATTDLDNADTTFADIEDVVTVLDADQCDLIVKNIAKLNKKAEALKADIAVDGDKYLVADIDEALADAIKACYMGDVNEDFTVALESGLLHARQHKLIDTGDEITVAGKEYEPVTDWDQSASASWGDAGYSAANVAAIITIKTETKSAIKAAKTIEEADAAFLAGYEKWDAVITEPEHAKMFTYGGALYSLIGDAQDDVNAYIDYKIGLMGTTVDADAEDALKDYLSTTNAGIIYTKVYSAEDLTAKVAEAKAFVDAVKTTKELTAEDNALVARIIAVKSPVTLDAKDEIVQLYRDVVDFVTYAGRVNYTPTVSTNYLVGGYVDTLAGLEEATMKDIVKEILKDGDVTLEDKAKVDELVAAADAYEELYVDDLETEVAIPTGLSTNAAYDTVAEIKAKIWDLRVDAVKALIRALPTDATAEQVAEARAALEDLGWAGLCEFEGADAALLTKLNKFEQDTVMDAESAKAYVQDLSIKARSVKTSKGVKVTIKADVQELLDAGYTVEYRFYRSTKSNKNFGKPMIVKSTNTYTNTKGVKGTRYYYKAKLVVKNAAGEVVATTPLTQCLYATRVF